MVGIPLELRSNERRQLVDEFLPFIRADGGISDERYETLTDVTDAIGGDGETQTLTADEWKAVLLELPRCERKYGLRPNYLRRKLSRRFQQKVDEL